MVNPSRYARFALDQIHTKLAVVTWRGHSRDRHKTSSGVSLAPKPTMECLTNRGFTLIEAVVATAVMVTIVAALSHLVLHSAEQSARNRRQLQALVLAQSKLEELRASPSQPVSGEDNQNGVVRRWSIEAVDASPAALLLRVCTGAPVQCVATVRVMR